MAVSQNFGYTGVAQRRTIKLNVTVVYQGPSAASTVTARANNTVIGTQAVTLTSGQTRIVTFSWNTSSVARGVYALSAQASQVTGETNLSNNAATNPSTFQVRRAGDIDGDGAVDISDLIAVWQHQFRTSNPNYYDINNDGAVDITDLIITWQHQFT